MVPKGGDGYVRTGTTVALKNLNPVAVKDANEFKELRMIYDRLFRVGPDGKPAALGGQVRSSSSTTTPPSTSPSAMA